MRSSSSRGWYQGPSTNGAGGRGWRPMWAVSRRRTSAGRGPANTRRRSSRACTSALQAPRRWLPRRNRLSSLLSSSTPYPALESNQGMGK